MSESLFTKTYSLKHLGAGWERAEIVVQPFGWTGQMEFEATLRDKSASELTKVEQREEAEKMLGAVKSQFVRGVWKDGVEMKVEDLESIPVEDIVATLKLIVGKIDPKA